MFSIKKRTLRGTLLPRLGWAGEGREGREGNRREWEGGEALAAAAAAAVVVAAARLQLYMCVYVFSSLRAAKEDGNFVNNVRHLCYPVRG